MGIFDSKKKREEELLELRRAKCEELVKIGFFGISKKPLDITTVGKYRANVEEDVREYLLDFESIFGARKLYNIDPRAFFATTMIAQAIGSVMYYVYELDGYDSKKNTIAALNSIVTSELFGAQLGRETKFSNLEDDFFAYKEWIVEKLIKEIEKKGTKI